MRGILQNFQTDKSETLKVICKTATRAQNTERGQVNAFDNSAGNAFERFLIEKQKQSIKNEKILNRPDHTIWGCVLLRQSTLTDHTIWGEPPPYNPQPVIMYVTMSVFNPSIRYNYGGAP